MISHDTPRQSRERQRPAQRYSLIAQAMALMRLVPRVLGDRLRLLGFELQRAGRELVGAAVLIVVALFLASTAWAGLWVGIVMALRSIDLAWPVVVTLVVLANLAGAGIALWAMLRLLRRVKLPATLRHLELADEAEVASATGPAAALHAGSGS